MILFTVVIPTYNGENRLPLVLDQLRQQIHTQNIPWEVIVVDNNSLDKTAKVVQEYQQSWPAHIPLRYYLETQQGAAFARQKAVEEAKGSIIGFLDDDNIPALDWVSAAYHFAQQYPQAGAFGGRIQGKFEQPQVLPPNFEKIACFLALVERGNQPIQYHFKDRLLPPGAGLVVRKEAWKKAVPKRLVLNHKGRNAKLASEDLEAILYIQKAGWEIWYSPQLKIEHLIPSWRLEKDYLLSLVRCVGLSRHHLRMLRIEAWQRPGLAMLYLLKDCYQLLLHLLKFRQRDRTNLVIACEREFLKASVVSPFFLWQHQFRLSHPDIQMRRTPPNTPLIAPLRQ